MSRTVLLCLLLVVVAIQGKIVIVIDGDYEDCGTSYFDMTGLEFKAYNDTHLFLDGPLKVMKLIQAPWRVKITMEKFENNKWQPPMMSRLIPDFCATIQSPSEFYYHVTKNWVPKHCPYQAGTAIEFKMQQLNEFLLNFPPSMAGKWRVNLEGWFFEGAAKKTGYDCKRIGFELVDI
ncbi:unnamed protein product [Diamesa serratosioi]